MIIVIAGPTGVGKTKMSIELAKKYNGEIINADSTQVYRNLDIATAKIKEQEKQNIIHHLIDIKDINEDYTVYDFQKDCRNKIDEIVQKNKTPIIVGGTGLYLNAALYDYKFEEEKTNNNYDEIETEKLYQELIKFDSKTDIHQNNRKRIIRTLNHYHNNNESISELKKGDKLLYNAIFIGLTTDRKLLYEKINNRVDVMIKEGLIEEAKKIYDTNLKTKAVLTPIGYKELFLYFENKLSLEESISLIKQKSRKYAKRQYTWFNNKLNLKWFNVDYENFDNTVNEVINYIGGI